jgi:lysophospholipase L1-like esterase
MTEAPRPRWFAPAAALLVVLVAGGLALLAEFAVRRRERHRPAPSDMMTTLYYRHARLVRGLVRNADYFGWAQTDSLGLRVATPPAGEAPETLRVLADGGSTTFDVGVSSGDSTWPARLGRLLTDSTRYVQVYNAGVPSYRVIDNLIRFEQELHRLRPHVIVLLQGHNDLHEMLRPAGEADPAAPSEAPAVTPWGRWLERHSLLYGKGVVVVRRAWHDVTGHAHAPRSVEQLRTALARGMEQYETDVRAYVAVAQALGVRVVLVEPPHVSGEAANADGHETDRWRSAFGEVEPAVILEGYARQGEVLRRVAAATGATYVPTAGFGLDSLRLYEPGDPIHFNDDGARLLADGLTRELRRLQPEAISVPPALRR